MAEMVATTQAGLAARAVALGRHDPRHDYDFEAHGSIGRILLDSVLCDGAALADSGGQPVRAQRPGDA